MAGGNPATPRSSTSSIDRLERGVQLPAQPFELCAIDRHHVTARRTRRADAACLCAAFAQAKSEAHLSGGQGHPAPPSA